MTLVLRYAARSDRGLVRANNEDSVYAGARLLALADGMGGHAAGEVASQLVIAALAHLDDDEPGDDLLGKLDAAVREGNAAIAAHVEADPELEGMGTTLTAILFAGNRLGLVHIGDSRGYLLRDGELTQITKDDTFVQTLVDEGRITAEEAHSHPQRSLIMRALTGHEVEPTLTMREARAGDRYLLCSDGLSDPVSHETIPEALQIPDVAESADRLIELALRGGGPDNVTVVVADVVDYDYGQTQPILAGAVSGDDDQVAPPNTAAGRASAFNPQPQRAPKRVVPQPEEPPPRKPRSRRTDDHRGGAARVWWCCRARHRPRDRAQQLLRQPSTTAPSRSCGVFRVPFSVSRCRSRFCWAASTPETSCRSSAPTTPATTWTAACSSVDDMRPSERAQVIAGLPVGHFRRRHRARSRNSPAARCCRSAQPAPRRPPRSPTPTPHLPDVARSQRRSAPAGDTRARDADRP